MLMLAVNPIYLIWKKYWRAGYMRKGVVSLENNSLIWGNIPVSKSLESRVVETVLIHNTGHEKSCIAVCLSAMADSRELFTLFLNEKRFQQSSKNAKNLHRFY
ncbi:hypothetical protein HZS_7423 [Henneguya salminicola]|nr:hypothetical protein HZS_7423 [Henneguya salminicola]